MRRAVRGLALALALAAAAPLYGQEPRNPCALTELEEALGSGGIGGTGILARDGGIGGTGIVGTVTGFGSVCVNGLQVHYDSSVPVTANGLPSDATQLAVGQLIAIEVAYTQQGLAASSIAILPASAPSWPFGPGVTRVWLEATAGADAQPDALALFGRTVRITADTRRAGASPPVPGSRLFALVRVGPDGAVVVERLVVPRLAQPPALPVPLERRGLEAPRDFRLEPRLEPRFEPRFPGPSPSTPGRMGR